MTTFLNIDMDGNTAKSFLIKHIIFTLLWLIGIFVLVFRIDLLILIDVDKADWLKGSLPQIFLLTAVGAVVLTQKWYYSIALLFYPLLAFLWFIPKTILSKGKIYLFGHYLNSLFNRIKNYKQTIIHFFIFTLSMILLLLIQKDWIRWVSISAMTYFFIRYLVNYLRRTLQPAQLFGANIGDALQNFIDKAQNNESPLIDTFIYRKGDENLPDAEKHIKHLSRLVLVNHTIDFIGKNLKGFKGRRAFYISLFFDYSSFLAISVLFFWFVNYQLFKINIDNFVLTGSTSKFEFLYYTFTTIFFNNTELIIPFTIIAKVVKFFTFFVLGIFYLTILTSIIIPLRQDKIDENIKTTSDICIDQKRILQEHIKEKYNTDINSAIKEVNTIGKSLEKLHRILYKIF